MTNLFSKSLQLILALLSLPLPLQLAGLPLLLSLLQHVRPKLHPARSREAGGRASGPGTAPVSSSSASSSSHSTSSFSSSSSSAPTSITYHSWHSRASGRGGFYGATQAKPLSLHLFFYLSHHSTPNPLPPLPPLWVNTIIWCVDAGFCRDPGRGNPPAIPRNTMRFKSECALFFGIT